MDKVKLRAKIILLAVLFAMSVTAIGCETAKGFANGIGSTAEGIGKDSYNLWNFVKRSGGWVEKNMW